MQVGLFVPCYIDQLYPDVGVATVEVLESVGCTVEYPEAQTCCGQPMSNTGCSEQARPLAERFVEIFEPYEFVVCPSGSCTAMVRHHFDDLLPGSEALARLKPRVFELCEFLHDRLRIESWPGSFPYSVGLHQSCHGLRELRLGWSSETMTARDDKVARLLRLIDGLQLVDLARPDECCGFGGTFAVNERGVSVTMGTDRLDDHQKHGAEVITAGDMSCLMHLAGLARRQQRPLAVMHVAQILAGRKPDKIQPHTPAGTTATVARQDLS